jgi:hypothetical protein
MSLVQAATVKAIARMEAPCHIALERGVVFFIAKAAAARLGESS